MWNSAIGGQEVRLSATRPWRHLTHSTSSSYGLRLPTCFRTLRLWSSPAILPGQFVTNYQMTNQVHERLRLPPTYVTANASAYAYPEPQRPVAVQDCPGYAKWPFGLASRTSYVARPSANEIADHAAYRPIVYLVGELDTQTLDGGFYGSCAGMAQGATRRARGVAFADS
jgi:hypothetical protein